MKRDKDRPYMIIYKDKWRALTDTLTRAERNKVVAEFFDHLTYGTEPKGLTRTGRGFYEFLKTSEENGSKCGAPFGNSNRTINSKNNSNGIENAIETSIENSTQGELKLQKKFQSSTESESKAKAYTYAESESEELNDSRFLAAIRKYIRDHKLNVNASRFFKYYKARGWRLNGVPIYDWKALVSSWAENGIPNEPEPPEPPAPIPHPSKCPGCGSERIEQVWNSIICGTCKCGFHWNGKDWIEE